MGVRTRGPKVGSPTRFTSERGPRKPRGAEKSSLSWCGGAVSSEIMKKVTLFSSAVVLAISASLLAGCGEGEVAKAELEQQAMKQLSASVGKESPPITCPGGLKASVGTKLVCSMPIDGKQYDVTIIVNAVEGTNLKYGVEVADKPRG